MKGKEGQAGTVNALLCLICENSGLPKGREAHGNGAFVVVRVRESLIHGEGRQV